MSVPRSSSRDLALVAIFAGVVAALGLVPAFTPPGFSVPITAQSLGVMLAGAVLGARRGGLSLLVFVLLVAVGLPLLAGDVGGLGERGGPTYKLHWGIVANLIGGILVVYVGGVVGLAVALDLNLVQATKVLWVYIPGDLTKVVIAALVARGVHAAYPGLLGREAAPATKEASAV